MPDRPKTASASKTQQAGKTSGSPEPFSPGISALAQQFSEKSRQQAEHTERMLNSEFQRFGNAIRERLKAEQKKTENAIADHSRQLLSLRRGFSWAVMVVVLLVGVLIGVGAALKLNQPQPAEWVVCEEAQLMNNLKTACRTR